MHSDATHQAFQKFREQFGERECDQSKVTHADQLVLLTVEDGRETWCDGPLANRDDVSFLRDADEELVNLSAAMLSDRRLWVVMRTEVATAEERCTFAFGLHDKVLKHSNLTGGAPAHCAGELLQMSETRVVVNGRSGRYGPSSMAELQEVSKAFKGSGYDVWTMGWDDDGDRPAPFLGKSAVRVPG